jgi:hypothetical protein
MKRSIGAFLLAVLLASTPATGAHASGPELPRGGRAIFPGYRVVAFYGSTGGGALGVLGATAPGVAVARLRKAAQPFETPARKVQIALELIVRIADRYPGPHGVYSHSISRGAIQRYLTAARRAHALLILDVQPGRLTFFDAVRPYQWALQQADVGIALDPEWRVAGDQIPGQTIGRASAAEVNRVSAYVADVVKANQLPEKLFVLHQFRRRMLPDAQNIVQRPGLAMVQHIDGFGSRPAKDATYAAVARPAQFHLGYKLFYKQDVDLYQPADVLHFGYPPEYVSYQ